MELWEEGKYKEAGEIFIGVIDKQKQQIENQENLLEYYRQEVEKQKQEKKQLQYSSNLAAVNVEVGRLWKEGWDWQHKGVFEARKREEKQKYLGKAIEIFRKIVVSYPESFRAEEAQFRIARIYFAFLKEYGKAQKELEQFINQYPNSELREEAEEMLQKIK